MAAGSIVVDLLMRTGSFETDTARATKNAEKRFKEFEKRAVEIGKTVGLALTVAGGAAIAFGKNIVDGLDALNDTADATGASIENISALEDVALRTGTTLDSVSGILVKFNNGLKEADGKNGISLALKAIGLDAEALKKIDPAEALRQTAVALSKFADDGDKARLIQELFGKSVREAAPFLKDLAEQGRLNATVTTQQAEEAEKFNKQLFELRTNFVGAARDIVGQLLPSLNDLINKFKEAKREAIGGSFLDGILGTNPVARLTKEAEAISAEIVRTTDNIIRLKAELDRNGGSDSFLETRISNARDRLLQLQATAQATTSKLRDLANIGAPLTAAALPGGPKPGVGPVPVATPKGPKGKDPDADFKSYLENLERQIQKTKDLSAVEKVLDDIRRGSLTVNDSQKSQLLALAATLDKEKEFTEQLKLSREAAIASGDAINKRNDDFQARLGGLLARGPKAQLEAQRREVQFLTEAFEEGRISVEEYLDATTGFLGLNQQIEESKSLAEELGLSFTSAFEDAIVEGKKFSDVLKGLAQDIARIVVRKTITEPFGNALGDILKPGGGGFGGIIDGIKGLFGFRAEGGPVSAGQPYIVGEKRAELFVPNTSGRILPSVPGRLGGGTVINQSVTIDARGADAGVEARIRQAMERTKRETLALVQLNSNRGGSFAQSVGRA